MLEKSLVKQENDMLYYINMLLLEVCCFGFFLNHLIADNGYLQLKVDDFCSKGKYCAALTGSSQTILPTAHTACSCIHIFFS